MTPLLPPAVVYGVGSFRVGVTMCDTQRGITKIEGALKTIARVWTSRLHSLRLSAEPLTLLSKNLS